VNKIYGSLIIFFYFIKYPVISYLIVNYFYMKLPTNIIINIIGLISFFLIIKDVIFYYKNINNYLGKK
jgi:hypothetical protein